MYHKIWSLFYHVFILCNMHDFKFVLFQLAHMINYYLSKKHTWSFITLQSINLLQSVHMLNSCLVKQVILLQFINMFNYYHSKRIYNLQNKKFNKITLFIFLLMTNTISIFVICLNTNLLTNWSLIKYTISLLLSSDNCCSLNHKILNFY